MITFGAIAKQGGGWLPLIGVADLADTLATLALPLVLGKTIDALVSGGDTGRWMMVSGALIALLVLSGLVDAFAGTVCIAGTTAWLRNRLVRHVLAIGPQAGRRFDTGDLVSRVSGNAAEAAQAGPGLVMVCTGVLPPIGSLALLAYLDLWLAVAFLAGLGLVALILRAFARRTAEVATAYQQIQGRLAARLSESLAGHRTIAAAGTVEQEEQRVLEPLPELHTEGRRIWQVLSRSTAQGTFTGPLVLIGVLATGGLELVAGRLSAGELFAAGQYAGIGAGLGALTGVVSRVARARAGIRRAAEVLTVEPVRYGVGTLPEGPGRLEFRAVTVRNDDVTLLDNVELIVPGGAAVAVVGGSGAGKSVLAAVAARLHEPDEGLVMLDGVPLAGLDHRVLRDAVGCAFERPVLVGSTIADAVDPWLEPGRVQTAARATHAHEFVSRLPQGYQTPLTEAPMSGGEAQRLGLARAWQAKRLLVLDDATSSLDMVTEMQISQTLIGDHGRRTRLIVTHRAATAARADLVVWLERGRVRGVGPHETLWADPEYRRVFG